MNAKEAKAATVRAEQAAAERKAAADKKLIDAAKRAAKKALAEDYDDFEAKSYRQIKKVTRERGSRTDISYSSTAGGYALIDKLEKKLKREGYHVYRNGSYGYENYGDFNAPCNVWEEHRWLEVSW